MSPSSKPSTFKAEKQAFKLRVSRYFRIYLDLLTLAGMWAFWMGSEHIGFVFCAGLAAISLGHAYSYWSWLSFKSPHAVKEMSHEGESWFITLSSGLRLPANLLKEKCCCTPYFILLNFKTEHAAAGRLRYAVPVFCDALSVQDFKQLYSLLMKGC